VSSRRSTTDVIDVVSDELKHVLGLRDSRFQYGTAGLDHPARLRHDGQVEWNGAVLDIEREGLPTDAEIEVLVENRGRLQGRFLLAAAPNSRPTVAQRLVAVTLVDQVALRTT
jgi:hypothetical protein